MVEGVLTCVVGERAEYFGALDGPPDEGAIAAIGARYGVWVVGPPLAPS